MLLPFKLSSIVLLEVDACELAPSAFVDIFMPPVTARDFLFCVPSTFDDGVAADDETGSSDDEESEADRAE